jgi:Family of unknown function (DUF6505)
LKLPRTIRLDPSDEFVFPLAALPGEWAVSGAFRFWDRDVVTLAGKERQAFRAGLLGIESFGWSTLIAVAEASGEEVDQATDMLAAKLIEHLGAPDLAAARAAAAEEIAFAASLCDHPVNTLIAVQRDLENGDIRERFRTLRPKEDLHAHARAFEILEEDDGVSESVDLLSLRPRE